MKRPDVDTIECFFLIAIENSTTMSRAGIDAVLGLIEYAKLQDIRVSELEAELEVQRLSLQPVVHEVKVEAAQKPRPMSEAPRDGKYVTASIDVAWNGGWLPFPKQPEEKPKDA